MKKAIEIFVDVLAAVLFAVVAAAFVALLVWGTPVQHNAHNDIEAEVL